MRYPSNRRRASARHNFTSATVVVGEVQRTALIASKVTVRNGNLIVAANSFLIRAGIPL